MADMTRVTHHLIACALTLFALACRDSPTSGDSKVPATLDVVSGDEQEGTVGTELPNALTVRVLNADGRPVSGQLVVFRVVAGGGSVFAGAAITDAAGIARERWTLGTSTAGEQKVEARAVESQTGNPLLFGVFRAVAKPGSAVSLEPVTTQLANQVVGSAAAPPPSVRAVDQYGNPVPGVTVMFAASAGGTVTGGNVSTATTGIATVGGWTLATAAGLNTLTASASGVTPVSFAITGVSGAAAQLTRQSADPQAAPVATTVAAPPSVVILDEHGNPVAGVSVTFAVTGGGGSVAGASQVTNSLGIATAESWTLGTAAGPNTVEARAADKVAIFTATGTPGPPATLTKLAGDNQSAEVGQAVAIAPRVRVADRYGNLVPGAEVAFTIASGGGTVTPATVLTGTDGSAAATSWTLGTTAGSNTLSVSAGTAPPITFVATAREGHTASLGIASEPQLFAFPEAPFGAVVRMQDAFGNAVPQPGVVVTVAISSGPAGATLTGVTATTDGSGAANFSELKIAGPDGSYSLRFTASGANGVTSRGITLMRFASVHPGGRHTCALDTDGRAYCWGDNTSGQLGDGTIAGSSEPPRLRPQAVSGNYRFAALQSGAFHTCGLVSDGTAYCWGSNGNSRLGTEISGSSPVPTPVTGDVRFAAITLGDRHTCAVALTGYAYCWGNNLRGELGDATTDERRMPTAVAGNHTFTSISAGYEHTCGLVAGGAAYCWGADYDGALGAPETDVCVTGTTSTPCNRTPTPVSGDLRFTSISSRHETTCAQAIDGSTYCWGYNSFGQVGDGTRFSRPAPTHVATGERFVFVGTAATTSCGLTGDGSAFCWGNPRVENQTQVFDLVPAALPGGFRFRVLELGVHTTCGVTMAGTPLCWGLNSHGQVGDGTTTSSPRLSPTHVKPPEL